MVAVKANIDPKRRAGELTEDEMKKIKLHKGLRHYFGLKVRGQHTNSTGRRGKTVGVSRTKA